MEKANVFSIIRGSSGLLFAIILGTLSMDSRESCSSCSTMAANVSLSRDGKIPLYIGGMMPMSGEWDGSGCLVAAELALEQINNRTDILPEYELRMPWNDTQCSSGRPLRALYDQIIVSENQKIMLLGPACSSGSQLVSSTSTYWNLVMVLYSATSYTLANRVKYPNIYRAIPIARNTFNNPYLWLVKTYGWKRVGFLSDSDPSFTATQMDFIERASQENVSVMAEVMSDGAINQVQILQDEDIRIIFTYIVEGQARQLFCEAYKHGLSGPEIVWIIPAWYREKWWLIEDDKIDCTETDMGVMIEGSLIIGVDVTAISILNKTTPAGITPAEFLEAMKKQLRRPEYKTYTLNNYMAYAYDSVWAIALTLNRTAAMLSERNSSKRLEDFTYTDSDLYDILFQEMAATNFFGASGDVGFFKGERIGSSDLSQLKGHCEAKWLIHGRNCYRFYGDEKFNWKNAMTSCEKEGAYLTNLETEEELMALTEMWMSIVAVNTTKWYIGLRYTTRSVGGSIQRTLEDVQNRVVEGWSTIDSSTDGDPRDCIYIDFLDKSRLKTTKCTDKKSYICKRRTDISYVPIGVYNALSDDVIWTEDINWPGGKVPPDGPLYIPTTIDRTERLLPGYIHILLSTFAVTGMVLVIAAVILTAWFSENRVFRESNPVLNYIILLSCFLLYFSVIVTASDFVPYTLTEEHHILICQIRQIITSFSFTLGVSTIVGKIWLVYKAAAFSSKNHSVPSVRTVYAFVILFVLVDSISIVIHSVYSPIRFRIIPLGEEVDPSVSHHIIEYYTNVCFAGNGILPLLLIFGDKLVLLLVGSFLSYEIKQASLMSFGESRQVVITIYNIIIFGACGLILMLLLDSAPTSSYIFLSSLVIFCSSISLATMFLPKVISAMKNKGGDSTQIGAADMIKIPSATSDNGRLRFRGNVPNDLLEENNRLKKIYEELQNKVRMNCDLAKSGKITETMGKASELEK